VPKSTDPRLICVYDATVTTNPKLTVVLVAVASLAIGIGLGWLMPHLAQPIPTEQVDTVREHQDLLVAYNLLTTTLEDESKLDRLGFFKTLTFDRPPETIRTIMGQVSDAADNTLKQLDRFRGLSPRIMKLPKQRGFGDRLQVALKEDIKSSLMDRSPRFSRRLLLSQAQALGMLVVLTNEIEKIDPNNDRKVWLRRVSSDFEKMYDAYVQHLRFIPTD
jgi:hypothetical protein